jgi:hypothetical protein
MFYLLTSRQARTREDVSRLLGVYLRWLASYAAGGLDALLDIYMAAGKPVSLLPEVLASFEQALRRPEGFASHAMLRQWRACTHGGQIHDKTL